jgi:predicted anti-sigma-YlaC factor YlaD
MHLQMRDQLERALSGDADPVVLAHLSECEECSAEFEILLDQAKAVRTLRVTEEVEPCPGFYARVMERIEAQGVSIWELFSRSVFGRRIAVASLAFALLLGLFLVTAERSEEPMVAEDQPQEMIFNNMAPSVTSAGMTVGAPDQDSVLANLVTYQEQ